MSRTTMIGGIPHRVFALWAERGDLGWYWMMSVAGQHGYLGDGQIYPTRAAARAAGAEGLIRGFRYYRGGLEPDWTLADPVRLPGRNDALEWVGGAS